MTTKRDAAAALYANRAEVMARLAKVLAEGILDAADVTETVAQYIADWRGDVCIVSLLDREREALVMSACAHPDPDVAEFYRGLESVHRLRVGEGLTGTVVATGEPAVLRSVPGRELLRSMVPSHRDWIRNHAPASVRVLARTSVTLMLMPLRARGTVLGAMAVGGTGAAAAIDDDDVLWLQQVADVCGLAIANARLYREASERLRMLEAARRVDLAMVASLDLRLTLDLILEELTSHLGVDAAAIFLAEGEHGLHLFTAGGFRQVRAAVVPHQLTVQVVATGRSHALSEAELEGFLRHNGLAGEGIRMVELLPLAARGEVLGVLQVFWRSQRSPEPERRLGIDSIAMRAALAIQASRRGREEADDGSQRAAEATRRLSSAQLAVFRLLVEGCSNREIADRLHLSENTVKTHLREVFRRLEVRTRLEAVMKVTAQLPAWTAAGPENHPDG